MPSSSPWRSREFVWLILLALLVIGAGLGLRDPWPADEPRFVLVAKQMFESGEYLIPHRGQEIYPDKPPLFMWLLVAAYRITGDWRSAFLLPSLFASLATIALCFDLSARLYGRRAAWVAALMLLFAFQFTYQAKRAQIDPFLVFAMTAAGYAFLSHALLSPSRTHHAAGWFMAAIGTISKGVGALALLMLPLIALARRLGYTHRGQPLARASMGWGVLALLAGASLWLGPLLIEAWVRQDHELSAYVREILFGQTARRYANPDHHLHPWWYFGGVIATTWLPMVLAWPWALPYTWRRMQNRRDARLFVPLLWAALVVLFFSLSPGKRDMYILPTLPILCVALAPGLRFAARRRGFRRLLLAFVVLLSVPLLIGGGMAAIGDPAFETRLALRHGIEDPQGRVWWMLAAVGVIGVVAALIGRTRRALAAVGVTMSALWVGFGQVAYPVLDAQSSARAVMLQAREQAGSAPIGLVAWREQNLLQAVGPVAEFGFRKPPSEQFAAALIWQRQDATRRVLFIDAAHLPDCVQESGRIALGIANRRHWLLLQPAALVHCLP